MRDSLVVNLYHYRFRWVLIFLLWISTPAFAAPAAVADWHMDEASWTSVADEVVDSSGSDFHGIASSGTSTTAGKLCNAADLSAKGISDYVTLDNSALHGLNDFTVSLWAKTPNSNSSAALISGAGSSGSNEFLMYKNGTNLYFYLHSANISYSMNLGDNLWHYIVWSRSGSTNCFYIDGSNIGCTSSLPTQRLNIQSLILGQEQDSVGGSFDTGQDHEGQIDEVAIYNQALNSTEIDTIYKNISNGNSANGSTRSCPSPPVLLTELRLDESSWNGSTNEVKDSSGNGRHGSVIASSVATNVSPVKSGNPGSCGYASQNSGSISVTGLPVSTASGDKTTVTFWMKWDGTNSVMPIGWNVHDLWLVSGHLGFNTGNSDLYGISSSGLANGWHHVVAEFTNGDVHSNRMWVDGVAQTLTQRLSTPNNSRAVVASSMQIGGWTWTTGYRFSGDLDEVRIYSDTLSTAEVNTIMNETHPCSLSPVADWHVDETSWSSVVNEAVDSSGSDFHGIASSGTSTTAGKLCNSADFSADGITDFVTLDNNALHELNDFTVSLWARTPASNSVAALISGAGSGNSNEFLIFKNGSNLSFYLHGSYQSYSKNIGDNLWQHIVWSRNGSTNCFYVNGSNIGCTSSLPTQRLNIQSLILGQEQDSVGGSFDIGQDHEGQIDEIMVYDQALGISEISTIYTNISNNKSADGSARKCPSPPVLLTELRLDESSWNGSTNEVKDSSGNGRHGSVIANSVATSVSPAKSGNPGSCGYASQNSGSISVTGLPVSTASGDKTTVTFWMKWDGTNSVMPIGWNVHDLWLVSGDFGFNSGNGDLYGITSTDLANTWTHVSAEFTNGDIQANRLVINGVEKSLSQLRSSPNNSWAIVSRELRIGGWSGSTGYRFSGDIDEVRVYSGSLSVSETQTIMSETHPCRVAGPDHFLINHDGAGIHCSAEGVRVSVLDSSDNVITTYAGNITLDTQTGTGDWIATTGAGSLKNGSVNDGIATYSFVNADNGVASFTLSYTSGAATFNIDAYAGSLRDDDAEGKITFAPSGYILSPTEVTAAGTYNDTIPTQTAGSNFTVHITAFGTTASDSTCGIIESYTGTKSIDFVGSYNNPGSGTIPLTINSSNIGMVGSASNQTISFSSGKAQVVANYKDAGSIRFSASDATGATSISGSTNNFVVKPAGFVFTSVQRSSDSVINPGATTASGTVFAKAGENFTVTVSAVNSLSQVTPNYGNESSAEGVTLTHDLVEPSGGASGTLTGSLSKQSGGVFSGTFNWSEVGIISLKAAVADSDYFGVGDITKSLSHVGRFTPDHFEVDSLMSGALDETCSAGGFNYIGQPFGYAAGNQPEFQILAKNNSGTTTQNYNNDFAKLSAGNVSIPKILADGTQKGSDNTTLMTVTHQQGAASLNNVSNGVFKYTVGNDQFTYDRGNNALVGRFSSDINLTVDSISDSDSVTDNFSSGSKPVMNSTDVDLRYGRLIIDNAFGSELLDLVLPVKAQMYNSTLGDFVTNTTDTCTSLSLQGMVMIESLDPASLTTTFSPLVDGEGSMTIIAPGTENTGSVGATLNAPDWLEYDWGRPVGEANRLEPKATATFGIYQGNDSFIYRREIR